MKKIFASLLILLALIPASNVYAQEDIIIEYKGEPISFSEKSLVMNNRTLVQLRPIAETLELGIEYDLGTGTVILSNADTVVEFKQNSDIINVNGTDVIMDVPLTVHNNYSFVPVRYLVEPFGNEVAYNSETKIISITPKQKKPEKNPEFEIIEDYDEPENIEYNMPFYYQAQPEFAFENNGRGYCWVCSYAMLFSSASGEEITPVDIANYNIDNGYNGNFMAPHEQLAWDFGLDLVPAISEDSPYYGGFNLKNRNETCVIVETDEEAYWVIREALENFPAGVIVRYEGYPHTMVAVSFDEENIYFNDPATSNGENILFEETCLKNYSLSDISFIQAVE